MPNAPPANWGVTQGTTAIIPGGVNSDYTAADYQDPLLALAISSYEMPPDPTPAAKLNLNNGGIRVPIPSLHRSDLIACTRLSRATSISCGR